jgi:hypothetical protein
MDKNRAITIAGGLCLSLFSQVLPAQAADAAILDTCATKSSGKIRVITTGTCTAKEYSLGIKPIVRGKKRPTALVPQFEDRYLAAKAAAKKKGYSMQITSGYRTLERQNYLYNRAIKRYGSAKKASRWVLPPKKSNHPWGIAIDVNYKVGGANGKKAAAWLEKNGYKYGLCRRYKNEWWHFEPLVAPGTKCPKMEPYAS